MSSLLTPVNSLKETLKRKSWIEKDEVITTFDTDSSPSLSDSSSEDNHMYTPPTTPSGASFNAKDVIPDTSLACQARNILGMTMEDVDNQLDIEWEKSRRDLKEKLTEPVQFTITLY